MFPDYSHLLDAALNGGSPAPSRHGGTSELLDVTVESYPGEMVRRDNINYNIGYVEALAMVAGVYETNALKLLAPNSQHVLFTINMAYGPRVTLQLPRVIEKLRDDPWTRQAIVFVGKPEDGATNDQPCTTTLQYLLRDGYLRCSARMRSWDLVKGLPYDLMMFHAVNAVVAHCVGAQPGPVTVCAASAHVYDRDAGREAKEATRRLVLAPDAPTTFEEIREEAQRQLLLPLDWPRAENARHQVPWLFREAPPMVAEPERGSFELVVN